MKLLSSSLIAIFGVLSALSANAADGHHQESASFRVSNVSENLLMLQGKGGNIAVLSGEQGLLMIDDDYKDMAPALLDAIKPLGGVDRLVYLINTHWHGDHSGGNLTLGEHATIVAHDNVRARLLTTQEVKLFNMVSEPYPEVALPSITYKAVMHLHMNNEDIEIVHFANGHTDGDSVVFFKNSNVVHMGDHLFNGFFPFVDVENGGSVQGMTENITAILELIDDSTVVIPGHGPLATKNDVLAFRDMLLGATAEVALMKAQGLSIEQAQAEGLSDKWNDWTKGFLSAEVWVGLIYQSLNK